MGRCIVKDDWFRKTDHLGYEISTWAKKISSTEVFCSVCTSTILVDKKGFQALQQHAATAKHIENAKTKLDELQLHLTKKPTSGICCGSNSNSDEGMKNVSLVSWKYSATRAEIIWSLKNVTSDMSAASCQGLSDVFEAMFPGCIPKTFSLNRIKFGYLVSDGLGPYFKETNFKDISNCFYTLIFDETTNVESKKELQLGLRFWSSSENEIVVNHLQTFFMGHATAENIFEKIKKALDGANLTFAKLLMLSSDGPNVNKKVFRLVNEHVQLHRKKALMNIGTCNIHIVHNAFLCGLEQLGKNVSKLIIHVYYYFKGSPTRWEDYMIVQERLGVSHHRFIKHVPTRWLTIRDSALRLLEQWEVLLEYFQKDLLKQKKTLPNYAREIIEELKTPTIKAELYFVIESSEIFQQFTKVFQLQQPLIHVIYDELCSLVCVLAGRVCKQQLKVGTKGVRELDDLFVIENLLPIDQISIGEGASNVLSKLSKKDQMYFLKSVQDHFVHAGQHIILKSLSYGERLKNFSCFQPSKIKKETSVQLIQNVAKLLPLQLSGSRLADEWKMLALEDLRDANTHSFERIDHFWREIMELKNSLGEQKYPQISQVVKASLSLSHGSADVERGFSTSGKILTKNKASMSERMLNAKLYIKDGMRKYHNKPELVPITNEMILSAQSAHQNYKLHLLEEQKKTEEEEKRRTEAERLDKEKRKHDEATKSSQKRLKVLENDLLLAKKDMNEQGKTVDKLFDEANERLKIAIKAKDMSEILLAQGMLQGVVNLREEGKRKKAEADAIQRKVDKKRTCLISNFFKSSPSTSKSEH